MAVPYARLQCRDDIVKPIEMTECPCLHNHQSDPANRARLRWRSRRGLLENDLMLTRFLDAHEEATDR